MDWVIPLNFLSDLFKDFKYMNILFEYIIFTQKKS